MRDTWKALLHKCPEDKISALAGALDLLHDAVLVRDMQGRVLYLNQGFELLTGCTAHEVLGKEIQDFVQIEPTGRERRGADIAGKRGVERRTENDRKDRSSTHHHEPMLAFAQ